MPVPDPTARPKLSLTGLSGLIVLLLANALLVWFDRAWAREPIII